MHGLCILLLVYTALASEDYDPVIERLKTVTLPEELKGASAIMVLKSSECSTTCGLGSKMEKRCLVKPSGKPSNCKEVRVPCVLTWLCDIKTYTLTIGEPFYIDCMPEELQHLQELSTKYFWRVARGVITVDDSQFRSLKIRNHSLIFPAIKESEAGTYRCDIQNSADYKMLKRIYYGIKVVPPTLVNLNFHNSLIPKLKSSKKKLIEAEAGNITEEEAPTFTHRWYFKLGVGSGLGMVGGIGIGLILLWRYRKKKHLEQDLED